MASEKESQKKGEKVGTLGKSETSLIRIEPLGLHLESGDFFNPNSEWGLIKKRTRQEVVATVKATYEKLSEIESPKRAGAQELSLIETLVSIPGVLRSLMVEREITLVRDLLDTLAEIKIGKKIKDFTSLQELEDFEKTFHLSRMQIADYVECYYHTGDRKTYQKLMNLVCYGQALEVPSKKVLLSKGKVELLAALRLEHGYYSWRIKDGPTGYAEAFEGNDRILRALKYPKIIFSVDPKSENISVAQERYYNLYQTCFEKMLQSEQVDETILAAKIFYGRILTDKALTEIQKAKAFEQLSNVLERHGALDHAARANSEAADFYTKAAMKRLSSLNPMVAQSYLKTALDWSARAIKRAKMVGHPVGQAAGHVIQIEANTGFIERAVATEESADIDRYEPEERRFLEGNMGEIQSNLSHLSGIDYQMPRAYQQIVERVTDEQGNVMELSALLRKIYQQRQ